MYVNIKKGDMGRRGGSCEFDRVMIIEAFKEEKNGGVVMGL